MLIERAINLLHEAAYGTLATHSAILLGYPFATVVPYVTDEAHRPVVCISALAEHTKNLLADSRISLSVLQPGVIDVQTARRLTIVGEAERFDPSSAFLSRYLRYEPGAEQLLALDFALFRLKPTKIRFIAGVGRMGWVESSVLETMPQVEEQEELNLVREMSRIVPTGIRVLGVDCYGIDYEINGRRTRQSFPSTPLAGGAVEKASLSIAAKLA